MDEKAIAFCGTLRELIIHSGLNPVVLAGILEMEKVNVVLSGIDMKKFMTEAAKQCRE